MRVLAVNAGSSSLKLSLLVTDQNEPLLTRELAAPGAVVDPGELAAALGSGLRAADAVGHRIVHGGERFLSATLVNAEVRAALGDLVALAPLHQAKSLAALDAVSGLLPEVPAVACFDTAFHTTLPEEASVYALPQEWRERWGVRRYGFHGLSHSWIAQTVRAPRVISCHLGAGASLCAIRGGRSIDTTMGFTPLAGLVMATRSGDVDPGLLLWLLEQTGMSEAEMAEALEHRSGLAGLGGDADMRRLLLSRAEGDQRARLAIDVYLHRLAAGIAAMAAALDGVDVLVFTGGVGERAAAIREEVIDRLGFLGTFAVQVAVAREDLEIAGQVSRLLAPTAR